MTPRAAIERADGVLGPRIEQVVCHEGFAIAVGLLHRTRHDVGRQAQRAVGSLMHLVNLPTRTDVDRLLVQVGSLERQLRELSNRLDDAADGE